MKKDLIRKIFHFLLGIILIIGINFDFINILTFLIIDIVAIFLFILTKKEIKIPIYTRIFNECSRKKNDLGLVTFLIGCTIAFLFSPTKQIISASIAIFTFGDGVASLIGKMGKIKSPLNKEKNLEGLITSVILASILSSLFINPILAICSSIITMTIEHINNKIDDNLFLAPFAVIIINLINVLFQKII